MGLAGRDQRRGMSDGVGTGARGTGETMNRVESLAVEGWSPEFGSPVEADRRDEPDAHVDAAAELPPEEWRPLGPAPGTAPPARVYFVDGVRRIEARVWMNRGGEPGLGICASYGAGVVRCGRRAKVVSASVRRGFFGKAGVPDLVTGAGTFAACPVSDDDLEQLVNGLQERMGQLEIEVAETALPSSSRSSRDDALMVVDGPLRGSRRIAGAIGYVKSHRVQYLSGEPRATVALLDPGRRTPVFLIQTTWTRYSWYLRLASAEGHPWAGIVRCESWHDTGLEEVKALADATAAVLPRFASEAHKDDRAPQNLYPIAGLERELGRRLGDRGVIYRALRRAASGYRPPA